jgi:hypothetical protein
MDLVRPTDVQRVPMSAAQQPKQMRISLLLDVLLVGVLFVDD